MSPGATLCHFAVTAVCRHGWRAEEREGRGPEGGVGYEGNKRYTWSRLSDDSVR